MSQCCGIVNVIARRQQFYLQTDFFCARLRLLEHSLRTPIDLLEHLAMLLPTEKPERQFQTMVNWGRFAELFGYNKDEDRFYLDNE